MAIIKWYIWLYISILTLYIMCYNHFNTCHLFESLRNNYIKINLNLIEEHVFVWLGYSEKIAESCIRDRKWNDGVGMKKEGRSKGKEKSRVRESYGTPRVGGGDGCYTWNCSLASPACRKIASRSVLGTQSGAGNPGKCQVVTFMRSTTCHGIGKCVVINGVPIQSHPE